MNDVGSKFVPQLNNRFRHLEHASRPIPPYTTVNASFASRKDEGRIVTHAERGHDGYLASLVYHNWYFLEWDRCRAIRSEHTFFVVLAE
jgi:hypothetical protein